MLQNQDIGKLYFNYLIINSYIRIFNKDVEDSLLIWHRDRLNRIITVISVNSNEWEFQFDNEIPIHLYIGQIIIVPKEKYHRLIKHKNSELIIKIEEY